jgi:hypothetical protein
MKAIITGDDIGTTIDFRTIGPYEAQHPWPEETVVSAGRGTVFVRKTNESYSTLFMEVYPPGAAFIRGEGETPGACEAAAWNKYQLAVNCTDGSGTHDWESRGWMNGAGFCSRCDTFGSSVFTGDELGQHCKVCGVGTTHHWNINPNDPDGTPEFVCEEHYVPHKVGVDPLDAMLSELFGADEALTTQDEKSIPDE